MVSMILEVAAIDERSLGVALHVDVMDSWIEVLSAQRGARVCPEHVWAVALRDPLLVLADQQEDNAAVLLVHAATALVRRVRETCEGPSRCERPSFARREVDALGSAAPRLFALWFEGDGETRELHFRVESGLSPKLDLRIVASILIELSAVVDEAGLRAHLLAELDGARAPEVQRIVCQ